MILFQSPKLMDQTFKHPITVLNPSPSGESGPKKLDVFPRRLASGRDAALTKSPERLIFQVEHFVCHDILHFLSFFFLGPFFLTFRLFVYPVTSITGS
jgi:hypothetical protein